MPYLNPLTSFIIEVFSTPFDKNKFKAEVNKILAEIETDEIYKNYFFTQSRNNDLLEEVVCFKWDKEQLYEIGIEENKQPNSKKKPKRYLEKPNETDIEKGKSMNDIDIPFWYPDNSFPQSPSFSANFLRCIGSNNFSNLWTRRNLYVLSKIFNEILGCSDDDLKKQLLYGFIQTLHLSTKMCVPRKRASKRCFSTSWGRSAYICATRKMEMNALMVFKSSCFGKQSVESCLSSILAYLDLGRLPKIVNVGYSNKQKNKLSGFDIKYGVVDINTILDYVPESSIDFIITDPPYGGLVQYLDLSLVWLNWLEHYDAKYKPNLEAEITIKGDVIDINVYKQRFTNALKNLYKLLKPEGKIVFTFHNKKNIDLEHIFEVHYFSWFQN